MLRLIAILVLATALLGCDGRKAQLRAFLQKEASVMEGYYSSDIAVAEASLIQLTEIALEGQRRGFFKGDVDWVLGLTHGRLHLIYTQLGRQSDADEQMSKALVHLERSLQSRGITLPKSERERREHLLLAIERLDQNREVKWKKLTHKPIG